MVTMRSIRRPARIGVLCGALGLAMFSATAPAFADNALDINRASDSEVTIDYHCDAGAGVTAIKAMLGGAQADHPSATGTQTAVTCDGNPQTAVVTLSPLTEPASGEMQVRAALVDGTDTVVSGQAKAFSMS